MGFLLSILGLKPLGLKPNPTNRPRYPLTKTISKRENPRNIFNQQITKLLHYVGFIGAPQDCSEVPILFHMNPILKVLVIVNSYT